MRLPNMTASIPFWSGTSRPPRIRCEPHGAIFFSFFVGGPRTLFLWPVRVTATWTSNFYVAGTQTFKNEVLRSIRDQEVLFRAKCWPKVHRCSDWVRLQHIFELSTKIIPQYALSISIINIHIKISARMPHILNIIFNDDIFLKYYVPYKICLKIYILLLAVAFHNYIFKGTEK